MSAHEYKDMAKSSGIIAMVQIFQMAFGLVRNKVVALLIGASGFGVWSIFHSFIEMCSSFSTFGLDQGGVREIAKNSESAEKIGKCIFTFRAAILSISILAGALIFAFAGPINDWLFDSQDYVLGVRVVAFLICVNGIAKGGYAILNGVRAIRYLALSQIISAVVGSIGAIAVIYFFKESGIPYALSIVTVSMAVVTLIYIKKLRIKTVVPARGEFRGILKSLLHLGLGFTVAGIVASMMTLCSRGYLNSHYSMDAVGIYQASWTIANLYIGVILAAMGVDFMPRLSKVCDDNCKVNGLIDKQIEFGICVASVGAAIVMLLAPYILVLLYSSEFTLGTTIIRWQILGVMLRIIAFPFSYAIMAKGKPLQYAFIQVVFWTGEFGLLVLFSNLWGFDALGINYFVAYIGYMLMTYLACRHNSRYAMSVQTRRIVACALMFIALFWAICMFTDGYVTYVLGGMLWCVQLSVMNRILKRVMDINIIQLVKGFVVRHK